MAFENVAYGLVTNCIAQVGQSPHDPIIAPRAIFSGYPHHQVLDLLSHTGTASGLGRLGNVTRRGCALAVPGQNGVGLGHCSDLLECFPTQLLTNFGQGLTVAIAERHETRDLLAKDTVLCGNVCIAEPDLFINRFAERSQQFLPVHSSLTLAKRSSIEDQYERTRDEIQGNAYMM